MLLVLCYLGTILIWGSTWYLIKFQLGVVPVELSSAYRFILAAFILFGWCHWRGLNIKFSIKTHFTLLCMGFFMFSLNYIMFYCAASYVISGLNAVLFSCVIFWNILNARLFLRQQVHLFIFIGATIGVSGLIFIFLPELLKVNFDKQFLIGVGFGSLGAFSASLGNILSAKHSRDGIGITEANAWGMLYGGIISFIIAMAQGKAIIFDFSLTYMSSLFYLVFFGSIVAFGCYLTLIKKIGADKGAYALILTPLVALIISQFFESFVWTFWSFLGMILLIFGNIIILWGKKRKVS